MYSFEEFCYYVEKNIGDYLPDLDIESVELKDITKNNGVILKGLVISENDNTCVGTTVYLQNFYEKFKIGRDLMEVVADIADDYRKYRKRIGTIAKNEDSYANPDLDMIVPRLVNYEKNKELLMDCPYIRFQDLAITFRVVIYSDEKDVMSCIMKYPVFDNLNITVEDLYKKSLDNYERMFPPTLKSMAEMLRDLGKGLPPIPGREPQMYILTNDKQINGATSLLLNSVRDSFADNFTENIYILPSSVHEFIVLPESEVEDASILEEMVHEVNGTCLPNTDILSETIYYYDLSERKISMVNPPESITKEKDELIENEKVLDDMKFIPTEKVR